MINVVQMQVDQESLKNAAEMLMGYAEIADAIIDVIDKAAKEEKGAGLAEILECANDEITEIVQKNLMIGAAACTVLAWMKDKRSENA